MIFGVAWRLRVERFDTSLPGYFVGLGARRSDFDLYRIDADGRRNYVFDPEPDATAAGVAAFKVYGRAIDVLLPKGGGVGDMVYASDINMRVLASRADDARKWQAWLWQFKSWVPDCGNPKEPGRKRYKVHMQKDDNGRWQVIGKEDDPW